MDSELRPIAHLIRQRQLPQARAALNDYLKAHPDSAAGWYLLSRVEASREGRVRALQQAAQLDPKYGERLARVLADKPAHKGSRMPWLILAVAAVLVIAADVVVWVSRNPHAPAPMLPTLAALNVSLEESPTPVPSATAVFSSTPTVSLTIEPAERTEEAAIAAAGDGAGEITPSPTLVPPTRTATLTPMAVAQAIVAAPSSTPMPSATPRPTNTPTPVPGPTTESAPAVPTLEVVGAIALREAANIGGGEMRVVDAFRQASALIRDRGGSVPEAPAHQEWVLVELLLVCAADDNCTPDTGNFSLTGSSGAPYAPAAGFRLDPLFGREAYTAEQVWGYLGFVVPNSETSLWLTLTQGDQVYRFALQ